MLFMTGHTIPAGVLVVMFVVPLFGHRMQGAAQCPCGKKKYQDENGPVMFVVQGLLRII